MLKITRSICLLLGTSGVAVLPLTGCKEKPSAVPPPPTVSTTKAQAREVQDFATVTARTDAVETVEIRARVSGYLTAVKFKDGQEVKTGDVLFIIDPRPYQAALDKAAADFQSAQADVRIAEIEFNRASELRAKNTIAAQEYDTKGATLQKNRAILAGAKAAYDTAKLNLDFTTITSPIDGQTSKASVTPGNLVTPDMPNPLTVIVSTNRVYAYADIDELQMLRYMRLNNDSKDAGTHPHKPTEIQLQLADEKDFPHPGVVDFADNRVNPDTGTISIRGVFDDSSGLLGPGMFVRLRFPASMKYEAILVPQEAIGTDQGQKFVYVVKDDGTVEYRKVELGALQDDGWRAIKGQISAGETVIVDGLMKATPGEKITPQPWTGDLLSTPAQSKPAPEDKK